MNILGINNAHNSSISYGIKNEIVFALAEERISRIKFHVGFPRMSLNYLLQNKKVKSSDIDIIAYGGYKGPSLEATKDYIDCAIKSKNKKTADRLTKSLNVDHQFSKDFYENIHAFFKDKQIIEYDHHLCHAAGAFYASGYDKSYIMTFDGRGDLQSGVIWEASKSNGIKRIKTFCELKSLGFLYGQITELLGYKSHRHEGKITGLAAFGKKTKLCDKLLNLISYQNGEIIISKNFIPFNKPNELKKLKQICAPYSDYEIAFAVQFVLEYIISNLIFYYIPKKIPLVLSGGIFGNVKLNQKIRELNHTKKIFIFPEMGDGGLSYGAVCLAQVDNGLIPKKLSNVYLGPSYSENKSFNISTGINFNKYNSIDLLTSEVAKRIYDGQIIGLLEGKIEFGPRSLGGRSLLFKADNKKINEIVNKRLNRTEFMPFAPVCLLEDAPYFYHNFDKKDKNVNYMTTCYMCTDIMLKKYPAVVHIDKTARPQVIDENHPKKIYYNIIKKCKELYGIAVLVNTSFNNHEEPIVMTLNDALKSLKKNNCDCIVTDTMNIIEYEDNKNNLEVSQIL